ncbi:unnamed protein product [Rotaria sp. Silwood1]|nr:unnamed protein product [Rotaria sp. Silwood1]
MSIPSILAACPNLHHLQVRLLYNNDNIITLSSPVNHSLRRLTLWSNYTELTFNDIDNILTYTPNLEHLYLQTVYHMPFIHLANGLINRLHHLSRFDCYIREILPRDNPIGNLTSDGKELIRIPASITGKDPPINDWTLVNVILPNEKIQVSIQLNFTEGLIAFNDIAVDYCDRPRPLPSKSLPQYPYEWSILKASNTIQIEHEASSVDYTFGNASRHYALLPNSKTVYKNSINSEVRKKHPSVPANFELKPVRVRHIEACGTIHDYKIALPDNKFVKISFLTGALQMYPPGVKPPEHPPEPTISVDDQLTSTADE